jgi:hypothetical protein
MKSFEQLARSAYEAHSKELALIHANGKFYQTASVNVG